MLKWPSHCLFSLLSVGLTELTSVLTCILICVELQQNESSRELYIETNPLVGYASPCVWLGSHITNVRVFKESKHEAFHPNAYVIIPFPLIPLPFLPPRFCHFWLYRILGVQNSGTPQRISVARRGSSCLMVGRGGVEFTLKIVCGWAILSAKVYQQTFAITQKAISIVSSCVLIRCSCSRRFFKYSQQPLPIIILLFSFVAWGNN